MKFVDLPELVSKDSVYLHNYLKKDVAESLKQVQTDFKGCVDYVYYEDVEMIRLFEMGDALLFSYRDDDVKVITYYRDSAHYTVAVCDKNIFEFIKKQVMENITEEKDDELIIPKLDAVKLAPMDEDFFDSFKSSFVWRYCFARHNS
ncbi:MAG: hypothetical protein IJP62_06375 [Treponema sp.]|nr:hypothetical protein [Treponema sp.]